ncbi:hypothetical protein [Maridesulfovibrio sp.]|uniref:hypothetical protein n=1 Tax=Maridesulfovibrio sp. TaxID=2795000 RepID=UPI002A18A203|nr:hypothetical protein [Maridesulfovibrio sp.]
MLTNDVYIHIGLPKTGTTFLQECYFPYLKDFFYFGIGTKASPEYYNVIHPLKSRGVMSLTDEYVRNTREQIKTASYPHKKILISDENFDGGNNFSGLADNCIVLKKIFSKPKIIFTFRRQDSFLESYYRECIKTGDFISVKYFLRYYNDSFGSYFGRGSINFDVYNLNWLLYYRHLTDTFGEENVLALPFEMLKQENTIFFTRMADFLGTGNFIPNGVKNPRHSYAALRAVRFLNRFVNNGRNGFPILIQNPFAKILPSKREGKNDLITKLRDISNNYLRMKYLSRMLSHIPCNEQQFISPEIRNKIMLIHAESNRELAEEIKIDLQKYSYY